MNILILNITDFGFSLEELASFNRLQDTIDTLGAFSLDSGSNNSHIRLFQERDIKLDRSRILNIIQGRGEEFKVGFKINAGVMNLGYAELTLKSQDDLQCLFRVTKFEPLKLADRLKEISAIVSVCRPQIFKKILYIGGMCGIDQMIFYHGDRIERGYLNSPVYSNQKIFEAVLLGMEQGRKIVFPKIKFVPKLKDCLVDKDNAIYFDQQSENSIYEFATSHRDQINESSVDSVPVREKISFVLGAEAGFSDKEYDLLKSLGVQSLKLFDATLRLEYAFQAAISQIDLFKNKL